MKRSKADHAEKIVNDVTKLKDEIHMYMMREDVASNTEEFKILKHWNDELSKMELELISDLPWNKLV